MPIKRTACCRENPMTGRRRPGKGLPTHPPVQATDRRAAQRGSVGLMVRFSAADHFQDVGGGVVLDLSENGCKLCSAQVLPIRSFRDLYLTIPDTSRPVLISEVQVVRAMGNENGIRTLRVAARERTRVRTFSGSRWPAPPSQVDLPCLPSLTNQAPTGRTSSPSLSSYICSADR